MALQVYPPLVVVRTIIDSFFPYRGLRLAPRGLAREGAVRAFGDDEIISDMAQFYYTRLDALRERPRGGRDWVVILILSSRGKYTHHGPDLRKLLEGVEAERPAKEGRLDELIVVAEEEFFKKKNLTDVLREMQERQAQGVDPDGTAPYYSAHPYHNFVLVVPEHRSVPPHRIMTKDEVDSFLQREGLSYSDLPVILTSDAPLVWLGARKGQVVAIARKSQTAGLAWVSRRVELGAL
jgi:DNA-directed RNA polymerase subunit H (RpoH/RPB5)